MSGLFSITKVKNEMDIIESFVRYHLNIFDGMLILDDNSSDKTFEILNKLKEEGLSLYLFKESNLNNTSDEILNQLLKRACEDYNANIIVPLDADEFIVSINNENPREIIKDINNDTIEQIQWKTYLPIYDNQTTTFSLDNLNYIRSDEVDETYKLIIPVNLYKDYNIKLIENAHNISYDSKNKIDKNLNSKLRLAHIPLRSKNQSISKIISEWLEILVTSDQKPIKNWYQKEMYDKLKSQNCKLSKEDMILFAKEYYSQKTELDENKVIKSAINLSFCNNLNLKYTENIQINESINILDTIEEIIENYNNIKEQFSIINEDILNENASEDKNLIVHDQKYLSLLEESYQRLKTLEKEEKEKLSLEIHKLNFQTRHLKETNNKLINQNKTYKKHLTEQKRKINGLILEGRKSYQIISNYKEKLKISEYKRVKNQKNSINKLNTLEVNYQREQKKRNDLENYINSKKDFYQLMEKKLYDAKEKEFVIKIQNDELKKKIRDKNHESNLDILKYKKLAETNKKLKNKTQTLEKENDNYILENQDLNAQIEKLENQLKSLDNK